MPKWLAEQNAKKKKEDKTIVYKQKKTGSSNTSQSSSDKKTGTTTNRVDSKAKNSTFLGGGYSTKRTERRQTETVKRLSPKAQKVASQVAARSNTPQRMTDTGTKGKSTVTPRATAAQTQKMYGTTQPKLTSKTEADAKREQKRKISQAQKSGDYKTASDLRGKPAAGSVRAKYEQWDKDIADTIEHTIKQSLAADARILNFSAKGITDKDAFLYTTAEQRQKADKKVEEREKRLARTIENETKAIEDIQNKHGYIGKQAISAVSSTTGMGMDIAAGAIIPGSSLFHMWTRSTGTAMGEVKKKADNLRKQLKATGQYSDDELDEMFRNVDAYDMANAAASGGIEVLSELLFPGMGAARKVIGGKGMSIAERAGAKLFNRVGEKASAGLLRNVLRGTGEEILEEEVGGPLQALASNLIYGNRFQGYNEDAVKRSLADQSNMLRSQIRSDDDARAAAARLSSQSFLDESIKAYMDSGISKAEATELAELSREYLNASLTGDVDAMKKYQDEMVKRLAGGDNSFKAKFGLQDAIDAAVSTSMMTLATGAPGAISTMQIGNSYKENVGLDAVRQQAEMILNWGEEKDRPKAQAIIDHIDSGGDMSGTQVYEIVQQAAEVAAESKKSEQAKNRLVQTEMRKRDLRINPFNPDGTLAPQTSRRYERIVSDTLSRYESLAKAGYDTGFSVEDVELGADIGAAFKTGVISSEQINELARGSVATKTVFEDVTGIDIKQFDSYTEMREALMAEAANNMLNSARLEQVAWNDEERGHMADYLSKGVGGTGDVAIQNALNTVDPRDRGKFILTGEASRRVYEYARNTEDSWDAVRHEFKGMFKGVDEQPLRSVFDAAKEDKAIAETAYYGKVVKSGDALKRSSVANAETAVVAGKFTDKRSIKEGNKSLAEESLLKSFVKAFGINVDVVDDLASLVMDAEGNPVLDVQGNPVYRQDNGLFDPSTNTLVVNANPDVTRTITQTATHELTHFIAVHAPDEYVKLSRYIMDAWYKQDAEGFNREVGAIQSLYKQQKNQDLSTEQALEELIANGTADFNWADENFVAEVTTKEPTLASKIIDAIKEVLRKLRNILASGDVIDPASQEALYSKVVELDTVRSMWVKAAQTARQAQADQAIDEWQDEVNGNVATEVEDRFSIVEDPKLIKALDADRHRTTYRAMALIDGKLYPPMATQVRDANGKWTMQEGISLGQWVESDITTDPKMFNKEGKFLLKKDSGGNPVPAAYNPYIHSSDSMLNDQFAVAYKRPNMVVVEGEIPESELTSGYRAEHDLDDGRHVVAKDTTGITDWKAGVVQGKLSGKRTVFLTNHFKPTRIVPDSEVAKHIDGKVSGTGVVIPYNVVTPGVREELRKLGTQMAQSDNPNYYVADAEEGLTINDGNARWTDERIDDLIERYGAKGSENYSQAYAVLMNPRDFLHITIEDELLRKWRKSAANQPEGLTYKESQRAVWDKSYLEGKLLDDQNFPLDEAELRRQTQTPFLYIRSSKSGQRVLGHEGRHRMRALMEAGVTSVPVVIEDPDTKTSKQNVDSMILGYQEDVYNGAGIVRVNDLVPIRESNRDELIQKFGGEAQVRFSITPEQDTEYMAAVERGDMETAQRMVDDAAAEAMPNTKLKGRWYHGTENEFTEFNFSQGGKNGTADGFGIYLTNDPDVASSYGGRLINGYANVQRPASALTSTTLTKTELRRLIKRTVEDEALQMAEDYDSNVDEAKFDTWISNYTDTRYAGTIDKAIEEVIKGITSYNGNDMDIIQEIMVGMGIRNYEQATAFYDILTETTGIDGFETKWGDESEMADPNTPTIALAFRSNQIKSADTVTYAEDGSVIPLSERFDPTNNDIRYSLPTQDSDGNILTDGQMEYFKNSQARDEQGRLVPVYHGTFRGPRITIFDGSNDGYWFTSSRDVAEDYSMGYEMGVPGAQIGTERNPYDSDDEYFAKKGIRIEQDTDGDWRAIINRNGREHYWGSAESKEELIDNLYTANENEDLFDSQFTLRDYYPVYLSLENPRIIDCNGSTHDDVKGTGMTTRELAAEAMAEGYDGIIFKNVVDPFEAHDVYVAFSSNQVKDINNENPTENPDIRHSIVDEDTADAYNASQFAYDNSYEALSHYEEMIAQNESSDSDELEKLYLKAKKYAEEDVDKFYAGLNAFADDYRSDDAVIEQGRSIMAKSKQEFFMSLKSKWNDRWLTEGTVLEIGSIKAPVRELVKSVMQNSDTDHQYRTNILNRTLIDARLAFDLAQRGREDVAYALLWHSALKMVDGVEFYADDGTYEAYKGLRDYLKTTKVSLGEEYWSDVEFGKYRKRNGFRIKLVKGETNVDKVYQELQEQWPEWFDEDDVSTPPDQLLQIEHVLDALKPYKEAYSSEEVASLATDIADELFNIMTEGETVKSLADRYKERLDKRTKALKVRHAEAMLKVRQQRDEAVRKTNQKWIVRESKRKERAAHSEAYQRIQASYKELYNRLTTNTVDKHIPEQYKLELANLLLAFDLQSVGSKKREARTGHVAKNTIRLNEMRTILKRIGSRSDLFIINDSITNIMEDLLGENDAYFSHSIEGETIDELSASELAKIDKLFRSLIHEFNNYEKVRVNEKKMQASDIGRTQAINSIEHAKVFGQRKDYHNITGVLDKIVNMGEMTPAYMFRQIDPNNEGIGLMWKEIRKSFDKYVRNQNQLNDWMDEIIGEYHQKGILWNKYGSGELSNWRSTNYAQTFNLENGPVTLTPAQIMSLYCLSKRTQAYNHMVGAGIVVAPVSFQAKVMSEIKKSADMSLPIILTDADIKMMVSTLTPDQIKVAQKLQELMSTKMAAWGNEASMSVIGIELFGEPDYFPIKSDRAALETDINADQFANAIRNFGFTKAVQPGARNAIMIDDIFDVVAEHCNNMNLYNAYSETINDFMKVFNYHDFYEVDGKTREYTVKQALAHAYSKKAPQYILQFIKDLNGNVSGRSDAIENAYNAALGNAKKAAVFANLRVAAQQPTAIVRAFAEIDPKYIKGIRVEPGAMKEMFEHCPIALWKSWGYYDINMGKSIEDIMMNNGKWLEDKATDLYGALDNVTWTAIWQMVKAETKDKHPDLKPGTDEYWEHCNERMSEIVDFTQVVDSPMHRSHDMRSKNVVTKLATAFMAEPTLTFNMVKDGWRRAHEEWKLGNKKKAAGIAQRTFNVFMIQAGAVAAAAAFVDALRKKKPDKDDEDERFLHLWWVNAVENFYDQLKLWNDIYFVKDIASMFEGWENSNLALQGWKSLATGWNQLTGNGYVKSSKEWYENMAYGLGYIYGIPVKTMMTGISNATKMFGVTIPGIEAVTGELDALKDAFNKNDAEVKPESMAGKLIAAALSDDSSIMDTFAARMGYKPIESNAVAADKNGTKAPSADIEEQLKDYEESLPDTYTDEQKKKLVKQYEKTLEAESAAEPSSTEPLSTEELHDSIRESLDNAQYEWEKKSLKAAEKAAGKTGNARNEALWDVIGEGYTTAVDSGNMYEIQAMKDAFRENGGDVEWFEAKIVDQMKSSYKKTIGEGGNPVRQEYMHDYMTSHGVSDEEISDIVYHSYTTRDLKAAMRIGNEEYIMDELVPLVRAGLSREDYEKAYKYRNYGAKTYDGKYTDPKYAMSTGTFIWPVNGTITSKFGWRGYVGPGASRNHPAIDIGCPNGTPVSAADGGVVIYAGWNGGYGNSVGIRHDNGMVTYYNHLDGWNVNVGDRVSQGQQIANSGNTGTSFGGHLDFKVLDTDGNPVDPEKYLDTSNARYDLDA